MIKKLNTWLYKKDSNEKIRKWKVVVEKDEFHTEQGLDTEEAKITVNKPTKCFSKNTGKANETSGEEQAVKEAEAKFDKKSKQGYFLNKADVDQAFEKPMLADKYLKRYEAGKIVFPIAIEPKLNGIRALYRERGKMVSRENESFHCVPTIIKTLDDLFPEGVWLDGEFYNYELRKDLNQMAELVSVQRSAPSELDLLNSKELVEYHVYDGYNFKDPDTGKKITKDTPMEDRRAAVINLVTRCRAASDNTKAFKVVPVVHKTAHSHNDVMDYLEALVADYQEGVIVRELQGAYENKRSTNLLKLKNFEEAEFQVLKVEEGKGNWAGYVKRVVCELPPDLLKIARVKRPKHDGTFASNIKGNQQFLKKLWNDQTLIVGKRVTIRYQNLSEFGVPQIPYIVAIRDYE